MLAVIGFFSGDRHQAVRLANWIKDLGGCRGHRLLIFRDQSAPTIKEFAPSFDSVEEVIVTDDVWKHWPESCNNVFRKACVHIEYGPKPEPWLWLEPDVVPLSPRWMDDLEAEYKEQGQLFLGDFVSVHTPTLDVPDHMSGVGVYPGMMKTLGGQSSMAVDLAWDVYGAEQIVPQMAISDLISHAWKHAPFADMEQVQREIFAIKPKCVLFHASKDGSLITLLRNNLLNLPAVVVPPEPQASQKRSGEVLKGTGNKATGPGCYNGPDQSIGGQFTISVQTEPGRVDEPSETLRERNVAGSNFTCDILIKSYPTDYELLGYCLRAVAKFATGFRRLVIVYPDDAAIPPFDQIMGYDMPIMTLPVRENGEGYLFQQAIKAGAHEFTDADYILHIDSDVILTKPITPQTFFQDGKPFWLYSHYDKVQVPWKAPTEKFMGHSVEFEFMRRMPVFVPAFVHRAISAFCLAKHGCRLTDYILSQPHREYSEFNALGAIAWDQFHDRFTWINCHE